MPHEEGSSITQSPNTKHNHPPDFKLKQFLLWLEETKYRAVNEDLSLSVIYTQQVEKDPQSAGFISEQALKSKMFRARKASLENESEQVDETETGNEISNSTKDLFNQKEENKEEKTGHLNESLNADSSSPQQKKVYCDDKGFLYEETSSRNPIRYLKCLFGGCKARGSMKMVNNAPVKLSKRSPRHNHEPDSSMISLLLNPSELAEHADENNVIKILYIDEHGEEQEAFCKIADANEFSETNNTTEETLEATVDWDVLNNAEVFEVSDYAGGEDYYHNEDQQKYSVKPSEIIPGIQPNVNYYHDGNGFYYKSDRDSTNIKYLKCFVKSCRARAYMELFKEYAPIILTNFCKHNHGPDLFRKQLITFLHCVTRRAIEEDTSIDDIYEQESERDPVSASFVKNDNLKQRMTHLKGKHNKQELKDVIGEAAVYQFLTEDEEKLIKNGGSEHSLLSYYFDVECEEEEAHTEGVTSQEEGERQSSDSIKEATDLGQESNDQILVDEEAEIEKEEGTDELMKELIVIVGGEEKREDTLLEDVEEQDIDVTGVTEEHDEMEDAEEQDDNLMEDAEEQDDNLMGDTEEQNDNLMEYTEELEDNLMGETEELEDNLMGDAEELEDN